MRIAIADDDEISLNFVEQVLARRGHSCRQFRGGGDLIAALKRDTFDLLILDWNMPETSGIEVIEWAKAHLEVPPPMLILTSRSEKDDVAMGLNAGADDFIIKPESPEAILARVDAVLRRSARRTPASRIETFGSYVFDRSTENVTMAGEPVELTSKEFSLALHLFTNQDRPLSRTYIFESVWKGSAGLSTRTVDMHISRVRTKLNLRAEAGYRLQTIFGYGYRLEKLEADG